MITVRIITPDDMELSLKELDAAINTFQKVLLKQPKGLTSYEIHIPGTISIDNRIYIENAYKEAGWINVYCKSYHAEQITSLKLERK